MDLGQWWSDNWQWTITTLVAVVGCSLAIFTYRRGRQVKQLDFTVKSRTNVQKPSDLEPQRVTMQIDGVELANPWITVVRIQNTGTVTLESFDFIEPIRVRWRAGTVAAAFVSGSSRASLLDTAVARASENPLQVEILPRIVNAGEWLDVQLLSDGRLQSINVTCLFPDQFKPMRPLLGVPRHARILVILSTFLGLTTGGLLSALFSKEPVSASGIFASIVVAAAISLLLLIITSLFDPREDID